MTDSQVAAAVITLVAMLLLYFMSSLASYVSTDASSSLTALCVLAVVATAEASGKALLVIDVTASSGMTETLTFTPYDTDHYSLTTASHAFMVSADEVDRLICAAKQLID